MVRRRPVRHGLYELPADYYESKCCAVECQIDELVYELYKLTDDERKIVEGSNP